MMMIIIRSQMN